MTMGHILTFYPGLLPVYFLCYMLIYPVLGQEIEVNKTTLGENAVLVCQAQPASADLYWMFGDKRINATERITINNTTAKTDPDYKISTLTIINTTRADHGNYTCVASYDGKQPKAEKFLDLSFPTVFIPNNKTYTVKATRTDNGNSVTMECEFEVYNKPEYIEWHHTAHEEPTKRNITSINDKRIKSTHTIERVSLKDNGTHECRIPNTDISGHVNLIVYGDPSVNLGTVLGISHDKIYLNWTVMPANSRIDGYSLWKFGDKNQWENLVSGKIEANATSFVVTGLMPNTTYTLRLIVKTEHSDNEKQPPPIANATTLIEDPVFVPNISINGFSATSVTIGWHPPPKEIEKFIHYYLLEAKKKDDVEAPRKAYHSQDSRNLPYMFDNLQPHSTYIFKVRACSDYTKECGAWSEKMEAATLDGIPGKPSNVQINCTSTLMYLSWAPPETPRAEIKGYTMELTGYAEYRDRSGQIKKDTWGPLSRFKSNDSVFVRFDDLSPNTQYTVKLSAMTRSRRRGEEHTVYCNTTAAPPDTPPRPRWRKILDKDQYLFKMFLPKVSERNGPICCYRVHVVRLLPHMDMRNLKGQSQLEIIDYEEAHGAQPVLGAYITDIFTNRETSTAGRKPPPRYSTDHGVGPTAPATRNLNKVIGPPKVETTILDSSLIASDTMFEPVLDNFPAESELVLGDEHSIFNRSEPALNRPGCERCLKRPHRPIIEPPPPRTTTTATTTEDDLLEGNTEEPAPEKKERRSLAIETSVERDYQNMPMMMDSVKQDTEADVIKVKDGRLDSQANYTVFVELIPFTIEGKLVEPMYSDYLNPLMPAPSPVAPMPSTALEIALQATCAVAALVLLVMIIFCVMQTRRSNKRPHGHLEMSRLPPVFRFLWPTLGGRQQLVSATPPDMPPIAKEDLPAAYAERHADSDYGFQKEFELLQMLSECFPDRTTHASEARENQSKNRYPDIKAYDQTRVKLTQIDGITGSDYINANYVMGYKERKKFICAQGPTDTTVKDFWRMVWEQGIELIVMLTNLEEYSKVKCSKYWPDEIRGNRAFGSVQVQHVSEKRYSDYIVRELKITKQATNAEGQPIVENNGVAKRNGDISKQESSENSAPTSPRESAKESAPESRTVRQYHFLMWKDFAAPEHPYSILKFIKRVNEAWAGMVGRPVVVHCSAGVGRTGTLVALDCLLEQLRSSGQVAVFNTVAELRRQRNFLVQSQKQYVFVYRALVEYAHYGDTEIPASKLKSSIDRLRNTPEGADKCLMEHEFEKMIDTPVLEAVKSCAAAQAEEVRNKNRSQECLPYDRNRVMLTPIPGRDYSTYINASFVEAYDNSEGFIITQDPLQNTIFDFWRMVSEQGVTTIVMLSELGEGKCPRYWDDGTAQYEHMSVTYDESESCPYYTRRQFRVTNNKTGHTSSVRQLQYQGWPTAPGHVPEVTRGLAELADAAAVCAAAADARQPMLVHCNLGTERSALFVALCILICQLRTERRVDVNAQARKVRAQRANTIDTFLQYEFLHRAILNYAELHNLLEDS